MTVRLRLAPARPAGALLAAAVAATVLGCGGGAPSAARPGHERLVAPAGVAARIDVHRRDGGPTVAAVVRDGDPTASIAAVLLVDDADARVAPALAAILEDRLRRAGVAVEARIARGAVILALDVDAAAPARTVGHLRAALAAPVTPLGGEAVALTARRAAELAGPAPTPGLEAAARCAGWAVDAAPAGAEPPAAVDLAAAAGTAPIERLRAASVTAARTWIGVVGPAGPVEATVDALDGGAAWSAGAPLAPAADAMPAAATFARTADGDGPLVVSVSLPRASAAPALARALGVPGAPLASRLRAMAPGLAIGGASGVSRAGGGGSCLRLDLEATTPGVIDPAAAAAAAELIRASVDGGPIAGEGEIAARAILEAADPREAATRAAWWATTADAGAPVRVSVALGVPPTGLEVAQAELTRAVTRPAPRSPRVPLERRVRAEAGQGAFRMIVATPCAPGLDGDVAAAETAIALVAAARNASEHGVEVTPFVDGAAAGLEAHADVRPGEPPADLARRVATALARGLAGPAPTASQLSDARFRLVEHASRAFGHAETADALALGLLPGRPTILAPLGLEAPLVRADAEQAGARLAALLRVPLRAAVIANADPRQADVALATFEQHLPPTGGSCAIAASPGGGARGRTDVRVPGDEPFGQIVLGLAAASSPAAADVAASLLGAPEGPVARAAASVGGSARAIRFGDAGVRLDVRVSPERLDDALTAVQTALGALARGEIAEASLRAARSRAAEQARHRAADPDHRLRALWRGSEPSRSDAADPRAVAAELAPERWTIVVARPG